MTLTIKELENICINALNRTYRVHEELGAKGEEEVQKNQFGETVLRIDIEAEKTVIDTLKEANVPIRIISEDQGTINLGENPIYLGVIDGLDGSRVYKKERGKGRYATMFGIFSNLNPKYNDHLVSGVMEHATKRLFFASKGRGSFMISNGERKTIRCSDLTKLNKQSTQIHVDKLFDEALNSTFIHDTYLSKLNGYNLLHEDASAAHYTDLACGNTDLVLECTRKGNLEIAVAYGLVTEAGGVVVTSDGISLKHKKYLQFGQDKYTSVISASTQQLAKELIKRIT